MKILIADDDITSRSLLAGILKKNGHEVTAVVNGKEAWEHMQLPDAPHLAIIDWIMPEMDGPDVIRNIRTIPTDFPPYLIMLTAKGSKEDIIQGLNAGANDYLSKPFDPGELHARIGVGQRMIELQTSVLESREKLAHEASHDPLTGLLNRRAILERLGIELERAKRNQARLVVTMLDIDHFKSINDTHGHHAGDVVIQALAKIMTDNVRKYDMVGRVGGEEFLIILPVNEQGQETDCQAILERLRITVQGNTIDAQASQPLKITISIGAAVARPDDTIDTLLDKADTALYAAKNEGRNRLVMAPVN